MKNFKMVIAGLMIFSLFACKSNADISEPLTNIQKIFVFDGLSTDDIFVKANAAAVDIFVKSDAVIEFADKDAGFIKGKFMLHRFVVSGLIYKADAVITVECKDGKARITISNITATLLGDTFTGIHNVEYPPKVIDKTSKLGVYVFNRLNLLISNFEESMKNNANSDW